MLGVRLPMTTGLALVPRGWAVPTAAKVPMLTVPAWMIVWPVKLLAPVSVRVPKPVALRAPLPLRMPLVV